MVDFYLDSDTTDISNNILELFSSTEINSITTDHFIIKIIDDNLDEFSVDSTNGTDDFSDMELDIELNVDYEGDYIFLNEFVSEELAHELQLNFFFQKSRRERLQHLPTYTKIKTEDPLLLTTCEICFENYKLNEYKRCLPDCPHIFHKKCIDKWLSICPTMSCPICRKSYLPNYLR